MIRHFTLIWALCTVATFSTVGAENIASKKTFEAILQEYVVARNGEVMVDVRISDPARWKQEMDRAQPWRSSKMPDDAFRFLVIHEYNRYHSLFLDRNLNVLSLSTVHVEGERNMPDSGPRWKK